LGPQSQGLNYFSNSGETCAFLFRGLISLDLLRLDAEARGEPLLCQSGCDAGLNQSFWEVLDSLENNAFVLAGVELFICHYLLTQVGQLTFGRIPLRLPKAGSDVRRRG
jgi:hypothetical protein